MNKYILTVTLNPAIDKMIKIDHFRRGQTYRIKELSFSAGGKGINVSRALKVLDTASLAIGFIGGYEGAYIKEMLAKERIPYNFVDIKERTRTSLTIMDAKGIRLTRILDEGPVVSKKETSSFLAKYKRLVKNAQYVVLSGRNIRGVDASFYCELIRIAQRQRKKTLLDTSGQPLIEGLKAKPFLIKPNLKEAEFILKEKLNSKARLVRAIEYFLDQGVRIVLISLGRRGAIASNGRECWLATPPARETVYTVGCGDAFIGGFLSSDVKGDAFKDSFRAAVASGTANSLSISPGHFTRTKVEQLKKDVKLVRL